jgi:hypothetical protein
MEYKKTILAGRLTAGLVRVFGNDGVTMGALKQTAPNKFEIVGLNKWTGWGLLSRDFDRILYADLRMGKIAVNFPAGSTYPLRRLGEAHYTIIDEPE